MSVCCLHLQTEKEKKGLRAAKKATLSCLFSIFFSLISSAVDFYHLIDSFLITVDAHFFPFTDQQVNACVRPEKRKKSSSGGHTHTTYNLDSACR